MRDPKGHSHGAEEPNAEISDETEWHRCDAYLWGIDLFNHGYYWEAHEAWEAVWHAAGRHGPIADFCKVLIKLAAAGVKAREGRPEGVRRHAMRARQLLDIVRSQINPEQQGFMGLELPTLVHCTEALINDPDAIVNTSVAPVVVVMPFTFSTGAE